MIVIKEEVVDVFRKVEFELVVLTETMLKGNGEVSLCGVKEIERAREGEPILKSMCGTIL